MSIEKRILEINDEIQEFNCFTKDQRIDLGLVRRLSLRLSALTDLLESIKTNNDSINKYLNDTLIYLIVAVTDSLKEGFNKPGYNFYEYDIRRAKEDVSAVIKLFFEYVKPCLLEATE